MCAALELNSRMIRPGRPLWYWDREKTPRRSVWAGFARREGLGWWQRRGGVLVDVPAARFAERSDRDRLLRWDAVPAGLVVRGLLDPNDGRPLLKIVTRAATAEEFARFEHARMPLLEEPLYRAGLPEEAGLENVEPGAQGELFPE